MINPVDAFVGARLRNLRRSQGHSQIALAEAIGVTFQQVQKYEQGVNRISASRLYDAARFQKAPIADFFPAEAKPQTVRPRARSDR